MFDCSLLYFSSSLSSLFVSLTNPEKPSARVGGGAVRQSRLAWQIPASSQIHRLLLVPQGSRSAGLGCPHQGRADSTACPALPSLPPQAQQGHSFVLPGPSGLSLLAVPEGKWDGEPVKFPVAVPALSGGAACTPGATGLGNSSHSCDF